MLFLQGISRLRARPKGKKTDERLRSPFGNLRRRNFGEIPYRLRRRFCLVRAPPHNSAARLAMSFPPSAACKFLDLHPVNLRNLHLHLTKNPFASRPPHLCGVTLNFPQALRVPKWRGVNRSSLLRQKCNSNYACKRAKISRSSARASSLRSMHRSIALIAVSPVMSRIDFSSPQ